MLNQTEKNMKKSVLALALAFGVTTAFAQDLTSKKGEPILPEAGDWGLGIDATPFLSYAKSFIGAGAGTSAPTWNALTSTPFTITGKYFVDEKTAYRGAVNLGFSSQKWSNIVTDDASTATPPATKEDTKSTSGNTIGLSGGIEMRKGKTRLQGYYGGEVALGIWGTHDKYTYGNAFSTTNTNPTSTTNWSTVPNAGTPSGSRTTDNKNGSTFTFGVRGFVGAEYFIMAKMSIGGEFGWGLGFTSTGEGSSTTESWNGTGTTTTTNKTGKSSAFSLGADTKNSYFGPTGSLRFNMYF